MKSKRIFFAVAAIMLVTSAYQNPIPEIQPNAISNTNSTTAPENTNSFHPIPAGYFSIQPTSSPTSCESSAYVKDVTITDGTVIEPGTTFIKKWKIKNTGSCAWNRRYSLQFASGDRMSGETTYLTKWVPPGETIIVSVELTAPETEGSYTGYWILTDGNGTAFGSYIYIEIVV